MCERNNSGLFFTCALIEQLGRDLHAKRGSVVQALGPEGMQMILGHADVFHCEPIEKVSNDMQQHFSLPHGDFDNVAAAKYAVPDVWTMGKVYARLIEDVSGEDDVVETLMTVYTSWIDEKLSDYNSSFYYQSRDYIAECYRTDSVIDA